MRDRTSACVIAGSVRAAVGALHAKCTRLSKTRAAKEIRFREALSGRGLPIRCELSVRSADHPSSNGETPAYRAGSGDDRRSRRIVDFRSHSDVRVNEIA